MMLEYFFRQKRTSKGAQEEPFSTSELEYSTNDTEEPACEDLKAEMLERHERVQAAVIQAAQDPLSQQRVRSFFCLSIYFALFLIFGL